jgi:XTP/dITP diphosphohydrolase
MSNNVVLASGNPGKIREFQEILADKNIEIVPQSAFTSEEVDETGLSFVENALLKARHACKASGLPAIADDSGLEVDALNGAPGIYSARFAGPDATDAANNEKLLGLLKDTPPALRTARFQCLLVYMRHADDPTPLICQGSWEGHIAFEPKGDNGFGYDPLFIATEQGCHSAELNKTEKNRVSHRGKAMQKLLTLL